MVISEWELLDKEEGQTTKLTIFWIQALGEGEEAATQELHSAESMISGVQTLREVGTQALRLAMLRLTHARI